MAEVILVLSDDISTDVIYPGRFMATVLPTETPRHAFADSAEFNGKLVSKTFRAGSVIVAGNNFGCGSSREQAVSCLKGHELAIVAKGFARIFLQNAVNLGLDCLACPTLEASLGDDLDILSGEVVNRTTGRRFPLLPLPPARRAILEAGGLIAYTRRRLVEEAGQAGQAA